MPKVTGYLVDQTTMQYVTNGGKVRISGDADMEVDLEASSAFRFDDVPSGSYLVSIVGVEGYSPTNKFLDIADGDGDVDLGWFAAKANPSAIWVSEEVAAEDTKLGA